MWGLRVQVVLHALAWAFPVWVGAASTLPPAAYSCCKLWLKTAIRAKLQKEKGEKKENRKKKKAHIWAQSRRPTYRIIPVYVRQLFILTWGAAGAGQKARAAPHLPPPPLPGQHPARRQMLGSRCSAAGPREQRGHAGSTHCPGLLRGGWGSSWCSAGFAGSCCCVWDGAWVACTCGFCPQPSQAQVTLLALPPLTRAHLCSFWNTGWCSRTSFDSILKGSRGFGPYCAQGAQLCEQVL